MKLLNLLFTARNRKIRPRSPLIIIFILGALILAVTSPALATLMPAVEWTSDTVTENLASSSFTIGFSFVISRALWVTHLGVYDSDGDGLNSAHQVGLWDLYDPKTEIASATVPANGAPEGPDDHFIYKELKDPILLKSGIDYVVGAFWHKNSKDPYAVNPEGFEKNPSIKWMDDAYIASNNLEIPTMSCGTNGVDCPTSPFTGWFGANLKFSDTDPASKQPVPEPQTMLLLGIGLIGLAGFGRRRLKT